MKKERPPCEGGPPQQNLGSTLPSGVNGTAVTSACTLPQTLTSHNFSPPGLTAYANANTAQRRKLKPKSYNAHRLANLAKGAFEDPAVNSPAGTLLCWLVLQRQWRKDRLIIVSYGQIAQKGGMSVRTAMRGIKNLIKAGWLELVKKGGSPLGAGKTANIYALGFKFFPDPKDKRNLQSKLVTNLSVVPAPTSDKSVQRLVTKMSPSPNSSPNRTHTHMKESPAASPTLEQWKGESLRLNPSRDLNDIEYCFHLALSQGLNGNWKGECLKYHRWYKPITPAKAAPAVRHYAKTSPPSPKPQPSSCESRPAAPLNYANEKTLVDLLTTAKREGTSIAMIEASTLDKEAFRRAMEKVFET